MRVVYMGTPDFAVRTLEAVADAGHEVLMVVTQPDKVRGRGKKLSFSPVKEKALSLGLRVEQPEKVREEAFVEELEALRPDVIVVVAFGQILPERILRIPEYGCINVHASLLPAYRGAAPIQWAVIDGLSETGVTTMYMDKGLDTGDIIAQRKVALRPDETGGLLFDRLAEEGAALLLDTLQMLKDGTAVRTPQDNAKSSYAKMLTKEMGRLDFSRDAETLERLIRGLDPWPTAYTRLSGKLLKILRAAVVLEEAVVSTGGADAEPGTILNVEKKSFTVRCGTGALKILCVQPEGRKRMDSAAFLAGYGLVEGTHLGV